MQGRQEYPQQLSSGETQGRRWWTRETPRRRWSGGGSVSEVGETLSSGSVCVKPAWRDDGMGGSQLLDDPTLRHAHFF